MKPIGPFGPRGR